MSRSVDKSVNEISAIAEENAAGAEEVSASVEEVTAAVQQVALTAQKLSEGENKLKQLISKFKINKEDNKEINSQSTEEALWLLIALIGVIKNEQ